MSHNQRPRAVRRGMLTIRSAQYPKRMERFAHPPVSGDAGGWDTVPHNGRARSHTTELRNHASTMWWVRRPRR